MKRKLTCIAITVCMLVSLFTCLCGLTASAAGTTPDLVEYKGTDWTCMKYTKGWSTIQAGNYKFTMDCKIVSGVPWIQVGADETGGTLSAQSNYTATYDDVNFKYIITFTMTSNWSGNLGAMVGNYGTGGRVGNCTGDAVFYCANPALYLLDGDGNPTGSSLINTFASDYYSTSRTGNKWNRRNFASSTATCTSPVPSGFFDPVTEPEPVVPDYVHFEENRNNYSRWLYRCAYTTRPAGNYRFTMDCKIFSGTPTINVGSADNGGNTFAPTAAFTNYTATYDAENYKYIITFTFESPFTGSDRIGVCVGNYGTSGNFVCANPELYLLDGSGDPTGDNLINTFASDYYWSSGSKSQLWERAGNYTVKTLPDHYFDKESTNNYMAYFPAGTDNYQVLAYKDTCVYSAAGTVYRLSLDVNSLGGSEPSVQLRTGSDIGNTVSGTLISTDGVSRVYEYTVENAATGIGLMLGNYGEGTDVEAYFANIKLYIYSGGAYGGVNILAPFNSNNYEQRQWGGTRANANNGKWTPINCSAAIFSAGAYDSDCFLPSSGEQEATGSMIHFPAGYDNYHVLAYKGGAISAGTYRFTVDEYAVTGITSYVNLFVNSDYQTAVTKGTDTLSGNKRTVEFTLYNAKDSFLLMIGNYGKGLDMDTYYENPVLKKLDGDTPTGSSLIDDFESNVVFNVGGTRANAEAGKWTTINWAKGYILFDDINATPKMLKLGGFGDSMNAMSYETALTPGETYQFDMDYRANGGVSARKAVSAKVSGNDTESLNSSNTISRTDTGTHLSVRFTVSSSATEGAKNFQIYLGQNWPQKRNGTVYFANLTLRKVTGGNLGTANYFFNGDFHMGNVGEVKSVDATKAFTGWNLSKVMTYSSVELLDIPENFFTDDPDMNLDKVYEFKGGDMYKPQFNFQFSSNRKYRLMYDYSCAAGDTVNAYIISKDNSVTAQKVSSKSLSRFEAVYDITVGANADPYNDSNAANGSVRFALNGNSYDEAFSIGNIRMYYLDENDNITGANLVYNLNPVLQDGYYGFDETGDTLDFTLAKDDSNVESQKKNIGISWVGNLNYVNENVGCYSRIVKTGGHLFDNYSKTQAMEYMRKALLGLGKEYNPCTDTSSRFYDINRDNGSNIADLVRFKKNAAYNIDAFSVENEQTNGGIYPTFNRITCYGDSITQGMGYDEHPEKTYPGSLASMLGSGYTVINSGDAGETSQTIMARQGAFTLYTSKAFNFPAGTATIEIGNQDDNGFVSINGDTIGLTGRLGYENPLNNIVIDGSEYTISLHNFVWSPRSYTVKLTRVGSTANAKTVPSGTKATFQNTTRQTDCEIYLVGANGNSDSGDDLVAQYKAMIDNHGSNNYFVIIPYFKWYTAEFKAAFGDHCIDFRTFAKSDEGFSYVGLTKTAEDIEYINNDKLPPSYRMNNDGTDVHLNQYGYKLLAYLIYEQGKALGYFDAPALRTVNQTYKYEIHMHDKEVSKCGQSAGSSYIDKAKREGFAGFVITNHFYRGNTAIDRSLAWADFVDAYRQDYEALKAEAASQDMDVLFGIEDTYDDEHHMLIYGISPDLWAATPEYPSMTLAEIYNFVHSNGGIMVYAHPFENTSDAGRAGYPDMRYADAIEVYNAGVSDESNRLAREYAEANNLRMTAGSDAHTISSFGNGAMEFTRRLYTMDNFITDLLAGQYTLITGK